MLCTRPCTRTRTERERDPPTRELACVYVPAPVGEEPSPPQRPLIGAGAGAAVPGAGGHVTQSDAAHVVGLVAAVAEDGVRGVLAAPAHHARLLRVP
eukprot:339210-Rhodomonas_salina.1